MKLHIVTVAAVVALAGLIGPVGVASADGHGPHEVTVETNGTASVDSNQTVRVSVTNPANSDLVSPIVEVPLRSGLSIPEQAKTTQDGTVFVEGITAETPSGTESRTAFVSESTFRPGTQALFIEGVEVPAGETYTYVFTLRLTESNELTIESDVRPLNNEDVNVRNSTTVSPVASGTINASIDGGDGTISVGSASSSGSLSTSVAGGEAYDVTANLATLGGPLNVSNVSVSEYGTTTVQFVDPDNSGTVAPAVLARTGGSASVIDGSAGRVTDRGSATTRATDQVTFDLSASGGTTVVGAGAAIPTQSLGSATGVTGSSLKERENASDVALLRTQGDTSDPVSVQFTGYYLGDGTRDGVVNSSDASFIASGVAEDRAISTENDVNGDGTIDAVDAMLVKQYSAGNRTADYDATTEGGA